MNIVCTTQLEFSGLISVNGGNGGSDAGGGSGGAIILSSPSISFTPEAFLSAVGGNSTGGGAGAGGRISVLGNGNFASAAYGGRGTYHGGPGTVFQETSANLRTLILDNNNNDIDGGSFSSVAGNAGWIALIDENPILEFDIVILNRKATLAVGFMCVS